MAVFDYQWSTATDSSEYCNYTMMIDTKRLTVSESGSVQAAAMRLCAGNATVNGALQGTQLGCGAQVGPGAGSGAITGKLPSGGGGHGGVGGDGVSIHVRVPLAIAIAIAVALLTAVTLVPKLTGCGHSWWPHV